MSAGTKTADNPLFCLLAGFGGAVIMCLPVYSWIFERDWGWAEGLPLGVLATGLLYLQTFFHELGHTVFGWFYGIVTAPSFDFQYGGGMTYNVTPQEPLLIACIYAGLAYALYAARDYRWLQAAVILVAVFHVATAFNDERREAVMCFMGPAFEPLTGGILLTRALMNWVTKTPGERFANFLFGFGMIFSVMINGWGLLHSAVHRLDYFNQKGAHGFGDFDRVANDLSLPFETVVIFWLFWAVAALILPILFFLIRRRAGAEPYKSTNVG